MWLSTLAYLSDVFSKLNELNPSLQGNSLTVLNAHDKIKGFQRNLGLWVSCVKQRNFSPFPTPESFFFVENDLVIEKEICDHICSHLETLRSQFEYYFQVAIMMNFLGFMILSIAILKITNCH